jgi:hypothetical protein
VVEPERRLDGGWDRERHAGVLAQRAVGAVQALDHAGEEPRAGARVGQALEVLERDGPRVGEHQSRRGARLRLDRGRRQEPDHRRRQRGGAPHAV